jgi:hypothetical protein
VLWTGWLGTSVHELSHAAMCLLFGHRIVRLSLFRPDPKSARLGYVQHAFNPRNLYHVVGSLFIGLAPLAGGAAALVGLLWLFFPAAATHVLEARDVSQAISGGDLLGATTQFGELAGKVLGEIFAVDQLASWRLWVFLYLTLCIGSHMAPSASDYRGALRGALAMVLILSIANFALAALDGPTEKVIAIAARVLGPALALFLLSLLLCAASAFMVTLLTALFPKRYVVGNTSPKRRRGI